MRVSSHEEAEQVRCFPTAAAATVGFFVSARCTAASDYRPMRIT